MHDCCCFVVLEIQSVQRCKVFIVHDCCCFVVLEIQAVQRCKVCNKSWEVSGSHLEYWSFVPFRDRQPVALLRWSDSSDIEIVYNGSNWCSVLYRISIPFLLLLLFFNSHGHKAAGLKIKVSKPMTTTVYYLATFVLRKMTAFPFGTQ